MTIQTEKVKYKPLIYLLLVFTITWICALLMTVLDYKTWGWAIQILDFIESASPLIVSAILLRKYLLKDNYLIRFFLGKNKGFICYIEIARK